MSRTTVYRPQPGLAWREGNMKLGNTEAGVLLLLRVCSDHVANNDEKVKTL